MAERECLQCGETPTSLRVNKFVVCGIVSTGETTELVEEFPRHRWADWNDSELTRFGVRPEAFEKHRRTDALTFEWIACDDQVQGHVLADADFAAECAFRPGQCIKCGHMPEPHDSGTAPGE